MSNQKISTDVTAFRKLVAVPVQIRAIRWEVFSTPEDTGGVPGPTDYETLIAEIEPGTQGDTFATASPAKPVGVVPGAARPWLDERFRALLSLYEDKPVEMSEANHCRPVTATLQKTKEPVEGFICLQPEKALLYLTLLDRT